MTRNFVKSCPIRFKHGIRTPRGVSIMHTPGYYRYVGQSYQNMDEAKEVNTSYIPSVSKLCGLLSVKETVL